MSATIPDEVRVGAILRETYEILSLLGEGGMGSVFTAKHLRLPKHVAVKVLKTDLSLSPELVSRFRREAEIASRLGHPNIVEVLDFDTLPGGTPFLVLEYLRGESLGARLARGPLAWEDARSIALQVGSALNAAHQAGVVHRDLKPDNIFLLPGDNANASYRVKLLDFGISKLKQDGGGTLKTMDAVLMGTPQYMSPEQALGKNSQVDARSDIFALGAIFYEMLAGQPAFQGENIPQVIYRIVHEQPVKLDTLNTNLSPVVIAAVERALAKDPGARFPDVGALTEAFTGTRLHGGAPPVSVQEVPGAARPRSGTVQLDAKLEPTYPPPKPGSPAPIPLNQLASNLAGNPPSRPPSGTAMLSAADLATPLPVASSLHPPTPAPAPPPTGAVIDARPVTPPLAQPLPSSASPSVPAKRSATPIILVVIVTALLAGGIAWRLALAAAATKNQNPPLTSLGTSQLAAPPPVTPTPVATPPRDPSTVTPPTVATVTPSEHVSEHPASHPVSAVKKNTAKLREAEREREAKREAAEEEERLERERLAREASAQQQQQQRGNGNGNGWARRGENGFYPSDPQALGSIHQAEQAVKEGQGARAIELGRQSQRFEMSPASHWVLLQGYCLQQDLGNARAEFSQVPRQRQSVGIFFCSGHNVRLR